MLLKKTRLVKTLKSPKSRKNLFWTFLKLEFFGTFRVVKDDPELGLCEAVLTVPVPVLVLVPVVSTVMMRNPIGVSHVNWTSLIGPFL
jgi:hypothetical protein